MNADRKLFARPFPFDIIIISHKGHVVNSELKKIIYKIRKSFLYNLPNCPGPELARANSVNSKRGVMYIHFIIILE